MEKATSNSQTQMEG